MCPECESGNAHTLDVGRDEGDRVIRLRQCKSCGVEYATIEVAVPVSFYRICVQRLQASKERYRIKHGGLKQPQRHKRYPPTVAVTIRVTEPSTQTGTIES